MTDSARSYRDLYFRFRPFSVSQTDQNQSSRLSAPQSCRWLGLDILNFDDVVSDSSVPQTDTSGTVLQRAFV